MLTLTEIGTVFALVGGAVFYFLLLSLSNREKVVRNRDLQQRVEEQAAQIQAIEARLRFVETALCEGATRSVQPPTLGEGSRLDLQQT